MRLAKDRSGKAMFQQSEWQIAKQISGFFSRLAAKQRKEPSATAVEQTEEDQTDGEEEEWEREEGLALMRQSVHQDINLCHPLQYRGEDLCIAYTEKINFVPSLKSRSWKTSANILT